MSFSCLRWLLYLPLEDAQVVVALRRVYSDKRQIRGDERPLLIGNVTWVRLSCRHAFMLSLPSECS
jgi:hypothetical protein